MNCVPFVPAFVAICGAIGGLFVSFAAIYRYRAGVIAANAQLVRANAEARRMERMVVNKLKLRPPSNKSASWVGHPFNWRVGGDIEIKPFQDLEPTDRQLILNWLEGK